MADRKIGQKIEETLITIREEAKLTASEINLKMTKYIRYSTGRKNAIHLNEDQYYSFEEVEWFKIFKNLNIKIIIIQLEYEALYFT